MCVYTHTHAHAHTHTHTPVNDARMNYLGCEGFISCWFKEDGECRGTLEPTGMTRHPQHECGIWFTDLGILVLFRRFSSVPEGRSAARPGCFLTTSQGGLPCDVLARTVTLVP